MAQDKVLPAAVAAGPAVPVTEVTCPQGKLRVHCKAEGSLPLGDVSERFMMTFVVVLALVDNSVKLDWAQSKLENIRKSRMRIRCLCTKVSHPLFRHQSFPSLS